MLLYVVSVKDNLAAVIVSHLLTVIRLYYSKNSYSIVSMDNIRDI